MAQTQEASKTAGKPIRCRAAVARKAGEPLVIEEITVAPPKARELRVRVLCSALCFSDIHFWRLEEPHGYYPRIFGHETVGVVESVGEGVEDVMVGDTVIPSFLAYCGECPDCISIKSNQCSKLRFELSPYIRDGTSRFSDAKGETIYHFGYTSGFSVGAAWKTADVEAGSTVAIFGLGVIGLAVAEGARLRGAKTIIGVDLNPDKVEIGKKFGITHFINPKELGDKPASEVILGMTDGLGADYCFECVGLPSLSQEAFACCRKGWGKTIILGVDKPDSKFILNSLVNNHSGKTITGVQYGGLKPNIDIAILGKRYLDKELQLDLFVTHEIKLEDINKAFKLLIEGKCLRTVIWMDQERASADGVTFNEL
ncbi:alcohol dehydrogenase-like 7 isoform X2 [Coffea eugenioides]|uniref:alcohol dehydrogenase-like 7 isoform X2 n=1 Tax=Coffea eugenioides TaxID=49369 RepID=UPI000F608E67|nr:alcohol dehydrogenase-like 7 isoform X2 [Coffea eugenioides]